MRKLFSLVACLAAGFTQAGTFTTPAVTLELPAGWVEVPSEVLQQFFVEMKRQAPLANIPRYDYAVQSTSGPPWLAYPYVLVKISPTGRPTERELTELPAIDLNDTFKEKSGDWSSVMKDTTLGQMRYDKAANVVWITSKSNVVNVGEVSGISGIIPTEKGFVELHGYSKTPDFSGHLPVFEKIITGARVAPALQYKPNWGDAPSGPAGRTGFRLWAWALAIGALVGTFFVIYRRRKT